MVLAPIFCEEGGSEGVSSQDGQVEEAIAWNRGGREGAGFTRDYDGDGKDTYVNALRAMTLWGAAKFR